MEPNRHPTEPEGRVLAAIVFTDAVGFTTRMRTDEVATLVRLEADFEIMRRLADDHAGAVLKSTGDGLLLHFTSAVQAVRFALAMQQRFAKRALENPEESPLFHRVGIHVGDVFAREQDVMGDGVNVAARLQAAADPGGICISQTVHDVIRNKLDIEVDRLPPRDLKNMGAIGAIYRVLLAPRKIVTPAAIPADAVKPEPVPLPPPEEPARASHPARLVFAAAAAVVIFLAWKYMVNKQEALDRQAERSAGTLEQLTLETRKAAPLGTGSGAPAAPEYDFVALASDPRAAERLTAEQAARAQQQAAEGSARFDGWLKTEIASRRDRGRAIALTANRYVHGAEGGGLVLVTVVPGQTLERRTDLRWEQLNPAQWNDLILGAVRDPAATDAVRRDAAAHAFLNRMPELARAIGGR